jgi:four helix bundle protein
MGNFRFEDLDIWKSACALGDRLDVIADDLERQGKRRYAEQLRGAALSVSNNIAEGSGSQSVKDFRNFLNIARRSVFENANMVLFLRRKGVLAAEPAADLLDALRVLSAQIAAFAKSLLRS